MAIASEGETSYRGGAGGKFQKRPARRHQTTPYDRPPSIVRNPRPGGWVSKLFDPASRFVSARAFKFFSNFRKRITEAEQEPKDGPQEVAPNLADCNEVREREIACNGNMNNRSEGNGISDLEQMLQQKTFTRSEIDRLTELLHSRTTESSYRDKEKTSEEDLYKPVSDIGKHNLSTRSSLQDNRDDGIKLQNVSATGVSSKVLEEDIASPAELAKAYMGRSSKVTPSVLGVRSQAFKEETPLLNHGVFPSKSSALSFVSKSVLCDGAPEKSFATPRSRGRSAIYNMARTPYSRGTGSKNYMYAGPPSSSSSSPQSVWEHNGQLGSKQLALKRRSSVLDDDSGSVGAIRRIRQKPNLLYNTSPLSARGTDLGHSAGQHHVYSTDKPLLLDVANNKVSKNREESEDDSIAGFRYPLVHSQSRQMASKILQQLEKITPQKSSESKQITARDKSPIKLTSNMLRGQALRSLEKADSTKFLQKQECGRLEDSSNALQGSGGETSKKKNIVEENGFKESNSSLKLMPSSAGANATRSTKNDVSNVMNGDSIVPKFSAQPQKKRAFRMTANEDFAELDDETPNGFASAEKTEELQIVRKSVSPQATAVQKTLTKAEGKIPENLTSSSTSDHKLPGGSVAAIENTGIKTPVAFTSNFQQDVNARSTFSASPSGESAGPIPTSWSNSRRQTSNSFGNDTQLKIRESDKVDVKNTEKLEHVSSPLDNSTSAAVSASTASAFVSSTVPSENLNNGLVDSKPFSHSIPSKLPSSNSTEQVFGNSSAITHSLTSAAMTSTSTSISSPSIFAVKPPSSPIVPATSPPSFSLEPVASPIFSFGASKTESSPATTVSNVAGAGTVELKSNEETPISNSNKPPSGGVFATTNAGNNHFGFSNSFASSPSNNQSQVSLPGFGSSSTVSSQSLSTTGASTVTQSVPFQFGSSGSSTIFGTSGSSFTSNVSVMGSAVPPANPFGSGSTSLSTTSFPFSSVPPTNPFGSSASSPSPSPLFSFGTSQTASSTSSIPTVFGQSTGTSSVSTFSFNSPSATVSPMPSLQSKPVFGSTTALRSPGNSGDQMNMEDSMAEDPAHSANPTVPVFGQPLVSSSNPTVPVFGQSANPALPVFGQASNPAVPVFGQSSNPTMPTFGQPLVSQSPPAFNFGSAPPPAIAASPFQFGGQQNQATQQNLPLFPTSNSLVNSGGSFSLGSGGGDKGNRKMVRISKNKNRRK
ncbi:Nuclear pore complex protein nup1 [Heracleum sosnowskyi]|uniref:Nuclear pore complex protein nup1 n=1 Tax=Heracleum sosnowskyi TaxID=360622 RepID=A0AAD8N5H5_9APIA|nr:Nuclear pore complex protein nup1 [Heracleum sosnowskyi]